MRFRAADVAHALDALLVGPHSERFDVMVDGVSYDSRALVRGQMFVAVRGDRDGHDYVADAARNGASLALVDHHVDASIPQLVVGDTVAALGQLAKHARQHLFVSLGDRVVGITGSVGKTSTKDFVRAALAAHFPAVAASTKSLNNDIGVPVTILNAPDDTSVLVLEMGMRGFGEIERLCELARPTVGVITKIGHAHTERVGGIDGVVRAKAELFDSLPVHGVAVVNADDPYAGALARHAPGDVCTFGFDARADVRGRVIDVERSGHVRLDASWHGMAGEVLVPAPGGHMASNALGAVAVALTLGVPFHSALHGVADAHLSPDRMQWQVAHSGARVLNDAYNANPTSMEAALCTLAEVPGGRRIAVLGIMAELNDAEAHHLHIASVAASLEIEIMAVDTSLYGVPAQSIEQVATRLAGTSDDCVILVKGSRIAGLERLVHQLS